MKGNKVQQGDPILFVEKDKPGQIKFLYKGKQSQGHMGIIVELVFIMLICFAFVTLII